MANIEDLPIWIVPFLTSEFFNNDDKEGKNRTCICGGSKHFRPYFCVQCEEGHLCKKMFEDGRAHVGHKKLQVRKVTERNSINIDEIMKLDNDDNNNNDNSLRYIVADVREYKYNGARAVTLLGGDRSPLHKRRIASKCDDDEAADREICKWCGHSTHAPDRDPKSLCSLGCALECKFDMSLQEIYHAQLCLKDLGDPHVPLQDIHMAVALMQMKNDKHGVNEETRRNVARKLQKTNEGVGVGTEANPRIISPAIMKDASRPAHDANGDNGMKGTGKDPEKLRFDEGVYPLHF